MLNLLPKFPQNILTQNCFYYNILQLLFPFWHVFFCIFRHFSCQRNLFTVSLANVLCFNTMPYFAGIDRHVPHTTQHGFGTVQSRHVKKITYLKNRKNVVFTPSERQTKFAKTSDRLHKVDCLATLGEKMQEKQKKMPHKTAFNRTPTTPKEKTKLRTKFRQIFRLLQFPEKQRKCHTKICEKRLTGYKKLQGGNIALKNARKAKKMPHKTACNRTPLPQKRKQNYAQSFGKFFAYCSFPKNSVNVTQKFAKNA